MDITKSLPLGLVLALIIQTGSIVWWASGVNTKLNDTVQTLETHIEDNNAEDLRQWARINKVEDAVQESLSNSRVTTAILERVEQDLQSLTEEVKRTNELLMDQ